LPEKAAVLFPLRVTQSHLFTERTKTAKMRVAVSFFLLISLAMAFKLQPEEPALLEDEEEDPTAIRLDDEQEDPILSDTEEPDDPALFDDEQVMQLLYNLRHII